MIRTRNRWLGVRKVHSREITDSGETRDSERIPQRRRYGKKGGNEDKNEDIRMGGWVGGWWVGGWMDGRVDGWVGGWMDGRVGGLTRIRVNPYPD